MQDLQEDSAGKWYCLIKKDGESVKLEEKLKNSFVKRLRID